MTAKNMDEDEVIPAEATILIHNYDDTVSRVPLYTRAVLDAERQCGKEGCNCASVGLGIYGKCNGQDHYVIATYRLREHVILFTCAGCGAAVGAVRVAPDA